MLAILTKIPGAREKPRDVLRRDLSRLPWVWDGLCFATAVQEGSTEGLRDAVTNVQTSATSGLAWTKDNRGNPALNMAATATVTYADNKVHDSPFTAVTAYVRIRPSGSSDAGGGIFGHTNSVSTPTMTWGLQAAVAAGGQVAASIGVGGSTTTVEGTQVLSTSEFSHVFLRWVTGGRLYLDVYNDQGRLLLQQDNGSNVSGNLAYTAGQGVVLNRTETSTVNWSGHYSQALLWNRRLSDGQCGRIAGDPFGWYSPKRESVLFASSYVLLGTPTALVHASSGMTNWG